MQDHREAGLLIRGSHQIREQGEGKRATLPRSRLGTERKERASVEGSHLLGHDRTNGALRSGVCGPGEVVFKGKVDGAGSHRAPARRGTQCVLSYSLSTEQGGGCHQRFTSGVRRALYKGSVVDSPVKQEPGRCDARQESLMGPGAV